MAVMAEESADATAIRPFTIEIPEEELDDLRPRIAATRWPTKELVADRSQGVQLATLQELARYWTTEYDWRKCEARLNALPQFTTEIDGVEIHFIHVRSRHEDALPLIMTHGWPGSVIELLETVGPLTDPTAHGGTPEDAFHLVLPSLPGYGFSGEPTELGWESGRIARAWAELMDRLGYTRYVAQGGDVGASVTDAMGRQAPEGLLGIHVNVLAAAVASQGPTAGGVRAGTRGARRAQHVHDGRLRHLPGAVHPAADDRLLPAGFTRRAGGLDARPRHGQLLQDLPRVRRRRARGQSHPGQHRRQHHAVLADGHRRLGRPVVLGVRTGPGRSRCGRPGSAAGRGSGRLHDVPRRGLRCPAQLGRDGLPRPRLLQRGRQGRPLRRLGGARALRDRGAGGVPLAALAKEEVMSTADRHQPRISVPSASRSRTSRSTTSAGASRPRAGRPRSSSTIARRACSSPRCRSSPATGRPSTTGASARRRLNALPQFTTEIDGVDIHFIHVRSPHEDALPLIMTHGWPGSVVELLETVGPLTDPTAHGGDAEDAFHLVLPSIPGYGFSGEPTELGWDAGRIGQAWAELMRRLGYTRYVAQGGDRGAVVTDAMARQAPEGLLGVHINVLTAVVVPGVAEQLPAESEQERAAHDALNTFTTDGSGYFLEMATRPQTIGYALLDSPVALAAWMLDHDTDGYYKIAGAFVDGRPTGNLTRDHILDNVTLYWLTGTGASAARDYWEDGRARARFAVEPPPPASVPVGFTTFPDEVWAAPRSWVEVAYPDLAYFNEVDRGGHFAAWEEPELFSTEVRAAFRSLR